MTAVVALGIALQQRSSVTSRVVERAADVVGLALLAAGLAMAVAVVYRWYARERVPDELSALVGLSGVALSLGTSQTLRDVMTPGPGGDPFDPTVALFNIVTFALALLATRVGADVGDHVGADVAESGGAQRVETDVGRFVQAVGRVVTVELPDDIDDLVGYDPVPEETKTALAGRSFVFPRRLTVDELRDRLVTRLKADYAVGHVDLDLADDGTVEYLGLGSRASGIGPTLPPETSAVAVRADPAFAASAGDLVQVWRADPMERVLTAELRATLDDVVTLAVDAADTRKLADDEAYKLVTLPVETRPDREFASILRAADETMAAVVVAENAPLAGQSLGSLDVTVVAVRPADGPVEALPGRDRRLAPGDSLYLVATPEAIRKVEAGVRPDATATAPGTPTGPGTAAGHESAIGSDSTTATSGAAASPGSTMPPDKRVDASTPVAGDAVDPADGDDSTGEANSTDADSASSPDSTADRLADEDAPGIRALERDSAPADGDVPDDRDAPTDGDSTRDRNTEDSAHGQDAEDSTDGRDDGGSGGDTERADGDDATGELSEWTTLDDGEPMRHDGEPTRDDLADLPGTDPDELTGTDVDGLRDADADDGEGLTAVGEGADSDLTGDSDGTDDPDEPGGSDETADTGDADDPTRE